MEALEQKKGKTLFICMIFKTQKLAFIICPDETS